MIARRRIRSQMYFGVATMVVIVGVLTAAGIQGALMFRQLTKNIRERAAELPLAAELNQKVSRLRVTLLHIDGRNSREFEYSLAKPGKFELHDLFMSQLDDVYESLDQYRDQLQNSKINDPRIAEHESEMELVDEIKLTLDSIEKQTVSNHWVTKPGLQFILYGDLESLQQNASELPGLMKARMDNFAEQTRLQYRTWMTICGFAAFAALTLLLLLVNRFRSRIFRPLEMLLAFSRRVASGDYSCRIALTSQDEMAELTGAINEMTSSFDEIQTDLNQQVRARTREVIRSEQMASVGFLAAGVAHEINNPLMSIAWSAESLESRLFDMLDPEIDETARAENMEEIKKYLGRIQEEAFRCKGITSSLLDFSRMGENRKVRTDLVELVQGVIEMVRPLGKYRDRKISLDYKSQVLASINPQEMKQVVLNLVTNALDSVDDGGNVRVEVTSKRGQAKIVVHDDGCGMTNDVMTHLFEPFFTRRRDGSGTGLGLSITYRIVEEHGGTIKPYSDGAGRGSRFVVTLPLVQNEKKQLQAA